MANDKVAYIYIMTNPTFSGHDWVKIGYAKNVEQRRKQLSTTALPFPYEIYATYEIPESPHMGDKVLHTIITNLNPNLRLTKNREFFVMTPQQAYDLLRGIAMIHNREDKLVKGGVGQRLIETTTKGKDCSNSINSPNGIVFYCKSKEANAIGILNNESIIVQRGSRINSETTSSLEERYVKLREKLVEDGYIVDNVFVKDIELNPSRASRIILGRPSNGNDDWKDKDGEKLKVYLNK